MHQNFPLFRMYYYKLFNWCTYVSQYEHLVCCILFIKIVQNVLNVLAADELMADLWWMTHCRQSWSLIHSVTVRLNETLNTSRTTSLSAPQELAPFQMNTGFCHGNAKRQHAPHPPQYPPPLNFPKRLLWLRDCWHWSSPPRKYCAQSKVLFANHGVTY